MEPQEFELRLEQIVRDSCMDSKDGVEFCIADLEDLIEAWNGGE